MIGAVVFWPQPPLLLPRYASAADPGAALRTAALTALTALGETDPGPVLLLTGAERDPRGRTPLGERVARALLEAAGDREPAAVLRLPFDADAGEVAATAQRLRALEVSLADAGAAPLRLLVAGDGSARASIGPPECRDLEAVAADAELEAAFAAADARYLAGLDPRRCAELMISGRAAWQVAAAVLTGRAPEVVFAASTRPYEVGYHVASWRLR